MSALVACLAIVGLVLVDLLTVWFGADSRPDAGQLPERWVGTR